MTLRVSPPTVQPSPAAPQPDGPPFPLALGTNVFGWTVGAPTAFEVLDVFVGDGGRIIDTADVYSAWLPGNVGGESETIIGRWIARPGNRERVVLSTKCGQHPEAPGLTRTSIRMAVEASLRRLRTDYIDYYFTHFDDDETPRRDRRRAQRTRRRGQDPPPGRLELHGRAPPSGAGDRRPRRPAPVRSGPGRLQPRPPR